MDYVVRQDFLKWKFACMTKYRMKFGKQIHEVFINFKEKYKQEYNLLAL